MKTPRVTEILNYFTSYDKVPRDILKNAAARGTAVHALCAGIAKGNWIPETMINEEHLPYVKSFKLWHEAQIQEYKIIEQRYTHPDLNFSGQMDFVAVGNNGETYLIDLKTSAAPQKTYPLQMAAYDSLLRSHGITVKGAMIVYLSKKAEFPEIHYLEGMEEEFHVFLSALDCWNYFHKKKEKNGTS